jgi:CBS domain-containing membrane protein
MAPLRVASDIMTVDPFTVLPNADFNSVQVNTEWREIRHVLVVDEQKTLLGILSLRDMLTHLGQAGVSHFVPIHRLMKTDIITVSRSTPLEDIVKLMLEKKISAIPVTEGEKLIGLVSERDFLKLTATLICH